MAFDEIFGSQGTHSSRRGDQGIFSVEVMVIRKPRGNSGGWQSVSMYLHDSSLANMNGAYEQPWEGDLNSGVEAVDGSGESVACLENKNS